MNKKIILLSLVLIGINLQYFPAFFNSVYALEVTPDTEVQLDDVVKLNYTLWIGAGDPVEQQNGTVWVHDPDDANAPSELYEQFPDLFVPPNLGFMENIIGMLAGTNRTFDILFSSGKAFNNASDPWYYQDLTYYVFVQEILLDATVLPLTLFDIPFFMPILILISFLILIIIYYRIKRYNTAHNIFGSKTKCSTCGGLATIKCGSASCNTPYCKNCFIKSVHCKICNSNKMIPLD